MFHSPMKNEEVKFLYSVILLHARTFVHLFSVQLRARSANQVSVWSNPETFVVSVEDSRPGDIGEEEFSITSFTYG